MPDEKCVSRTHVGRAGEIRGEIFLPCAAGSLDSLRLPGWTLWSLLRNAKLGGWVVGHSVSRGGWSDAVIVV